MLVNYFLDKYNKRRKKSIRGISDRAMETIMADDWPGNVRELENAVERAVVLTNSDFIQPSDLTYYGTGAQEEPFKEKTIEEMEKDHILNTLQAHDGHKIKTAETLGIDRKTLRLKMRKHGIEE